MTKEITGGSLIVCPADQSDAGSEGSATRWTLVISGCWGWEVGSGLPKHARSFSLVNPALLIVCCTFSRQTPPGRVVLAVSSQDSG